MSGHQVEDNREPLIHFILLFPESDSQLRSNVIAICHDVNCHVVNSMELSEPHFLWLIHRKWKSLSVRSPYCGRPCMLNIYIRLDTCLMSISRFSWRDKVTLRLLKLYFIADVAAWSRVMDIRLSDWCCSVSMVWAQIPSREEHKFVSSKI